MPPAQPSRRKPENPHDAAPADHQCRDAPRSMPDPSSRRPPDIAGRLREAGFYRREPIQRALTSYDLGSLFWEARHALELTQAQLGEVLGLDQKRIPQIERGQRRLTGSIQTLARIATRLGIHPTLLGLCCCADPAGMAAQPAAPTEGEVSAADPDRAGE